MLRRIGSRYDDRLAEDAPGPSAGGADQAMSEAIGYSVMLDVRRMAARHRDDRQALAVRLEHSLGKVRDVMARNGEAAVTDRALRFTVNTAAAAKLEDLSVTPRDLRPLLGLEERTESVG